MRERSIVLSKRLRMLADMVSAGSRVADVGCDHGFLPIWLVQTGVSPRALAMDVRRGPLAAAREHVEKCGLGEYIELRLSDGLLGIEPGEADTLVCAGMGGRLMERILAENMEKTRSFGELILQPQSELGEFRAFLRREGFCILEEEAVREDGKYYFAMRAVCGSASPGQVEMELPSGAPSQSDGAAAQQLMRERVRDKFGEGLLSRKHPVLRDFLLRQRETLAGISRALQDSDSSRQRERLAEILEELADVEYALRLTE